MDRDCWKMFRGKIRMHTCRIILFTSLVWFLVDVAVLVYFSDSSSNSAAVAGQLVAAEAQLNKRDVQGDAHPSAASHFASAKVVVPNEEVVRFSFFK